MKLAWIARENRGVPAAQADGPWIEVSAAWEAYARSLGLVDLPPPRDLRDMIEHGAASPEFIHFAHDFSVRETIENPRFLQPLTPRKIIGMGRNYLEHVRELNNDVPPEPLFFAKSPTATIGPEESIVIEPWYGRVDHEGEITVVVGRRCRHVSSADAMNYVAGFTLLNDVTAREMQKRDMDMGHPWFRSKSLDTFCPVGPSITLTASIPLPLELDIAVRVNGEVRQQSNTRQFIYSLPDMIAYVSRHMTLEPGDLIATGTPEGISALKHGDVVEVESPLLGTLRNPVVVVS